MLAFFFFNAGAIAVVRPVEVIEQILAFHLPVTIITLIFVSIVVASGLVPRWTGALVVFAYAAFVAGTY